VYGIQSTNHVLVDVVEAMEETVESTTKEEREDLEVLAELLTPQSSLESRRPRRHTLRERFLRNGCSLQ
jgi:hypothetical protein